MTTNDPIHTLKNLQPKGPVKRKSARKVWRKIWRTFALSFSVLLTIGLLLSAYGGALSPQTWHGYNGIMQMTFPLWLIACILMLVIDLIWYWHGAIILIFGLISCAYPIYDFSPFNLPREPLTDEEMQRSFTLLTYNVQNFDIFQDDENAFDGENSTVRYILDTDADIVCLQEADIEAKKNETHVSSSQLKQLHEQYPFNYLSAINQVIYSKYPIEPIRLSFADKSGEGLISAYRVNVEGTPITIFNVHLQSIGLTEDDKSLYMELTDIKDLKVTTKQQIKEAKSQLLSKLAAANLKRAEQIDKLIIAMRQIGGPNVIICGDFNDVPGSYALRELTDCGLKQVYPEVCMGPTITFYVNRFYFRIDHVLYRGAFKPVRQQRGDVKYSDHYPVLTRFLLDNSAE
jgi:endonuclease/exonuclease/phosphatase (EEP) superfamily protein YafD